MLRFFRQIRQRLLTENRFSKYLLYAVGEILLVVIGILIALRINLYKEVEQRVLNEHYVNYYKPMIIEAFKTVDKTDLIPIDYATFIENQEYRQVLVHSIQICADMSDFQGFLFEILDFPV